MWEQWSANGRKVACPAGHIYDELNTYRWGGMRFCRACHRDAERARRARKAAPEGSVVSTTADVGVAG